MTTDVLILGSGVAGLSSALYLHARKPDIEITIVTKSQETESNSFYAQGGIAAVLSRNVSHTHDSLEQHIQDTLTAGSNHNAIEAVELLVQQAEQQITFLEENGVIFDSDIGLEGGHSARRILHVADKTGSAITSALLRAVHEIPNITIVEDSEAISLLQAKQGNEVGGAVVQNQETGETTIITSRYAVLLATGGAAALYQKTTNPKVTIGNGIALAIEAGAEIEDMEFIQFHPTALHLPNTPSFLLSEALRGEGAHIIDETGKRFMADMHPLAELAPRDVVAGAVYNHMQAGHSVYLNLTHIEQDVLDTHFPYILKTLASYGVDAKNQAIPIAPAAHYLCGGVKTDLRARTSVPRLYAVGEVARTGVHGANRLASNSLLECLVFAEQAAADIAALKPLEQSVEQVYAGTSEQQLTTDFLQEVKEILWRYAGVNRTPEGLAAAEIALSNMTTKSTREKHVLLVANAIIDAALQRAESLGSHNISSQ